MMRRSFLTLSLLATSNLALVNGITNNEQLPKNRTNNINFQNNNITILQKVKLPLINNTPIITDSSYQISTNIFVSLQLQKVGTNFITKFYYIDVSDVNNIIINECGQTSSILSPFYFVRISLAPRKVILYHQFTHEYVYLDVSNPTQAIIKPLIAASHDGHNAIIKSISAINENNIIISTNDGIFTVDLSDIDYPHSYFWDTQDIYVSDFVKLTNNKYLIAGIISSPPGQIFQFYCFDLNSDIHQPIISKINLEVSQMHMMKLEKVLADDSFIFSADKNLYYCNLSSLAKPVFTKLNIVFQANYDYLSKVDDYNLLVTSTITIKPPFVQPLLIAVHIAGNDNITCTPIVLPPISNIQMLVGLVYLNDHKFILRILHDNNKIVTYSLDLTNKLQPQWTDTKLGTDNLLWKPVKLSLSRVLLNDSDNNAWIGFYH